MKLKKRKANITYSQIKTMKYYGIVLINYTRHILNITKHC